MKKLILMSCFAFASLLTNAQIKVWPTTKNVSIGNTTTTPSSMFDVGSNAGNSLYQIYSYNSQTGSHSTGVMGQVASPTTAGYFAKGVTGYVVPATANSYAIGVFGSSYSPTTTTGRTYGVYGQAGGGTSGYNYGLYGYILNTGGNKGAAIFGTASGDVDVSTYGADGFFAGFFNGEFLTTDDSPQKPTTGGFTGYSDKRLKKNIAPFKDGIEVLRKVNPVSYQFNGIGNLPTGKTHIGVLAQDIQKVAPYCIGTSHLRVKQSESGNFAGDIVKSLPADSSGETGNLVNVLTYNYDDLIYVIVNSVKQLDSTITSLKTGLTSVKSQRTMQNNNNEPNAANSNKQIESLKAENEKIKKELLSLQQRLDAIEKK